MKLGAFSISLAVKDLAVSRAFYQNLGFDDMGGVPAQNWIIMKNGDTVIGLFQGMFDSNIMTFNPGWDQSAQPVDPFTDIRDVQKHLKSEGVALEAEADPATSGPASLMLKDPDGNVILIDQHR
ncbi:MAG: VOC family protein [Paracoccaceae bacterium]|nr:VOC family protein [Paracoccaceae bacterium]MDG2258806.1 VOC family protein [Paracoccaceae bacterium]